MFSRYRIPESRVVFTLIAASLLVAANDRVFAQDLVANDPLPKEVSVMTWNVEWFFDANTNDNVSDLSKRLSAPSDASWQWKLSAVAEGIAKAKPSIVALQEIENRRVLEALVQKLRDEHRLYYRVAFIEGFDSATEQDVGILMQSGLAEITRFEQSKPMYDSQQYYNLSKHLYCRFRWGNDADTEELAIMNVHLRAKAEEAALRVKQSKLLKHWLRNDLGQNRNMLIVGDLNTEEFASSVQPNSDMAILLGIATPDATDDMIDLLERAPSNKRRTHLILDEQFDRIIASPSLISDAPEKPDLVFRNIEVLPELVIRGQGIDSLSDHWDNYWKLSDAERDVSDHYPLKATFDIR